MTIIPSIPRLQILLTRASHQPHSLTTNYLEDGNIEVLFCLGIHSSASMLALYPSSLLHFVKCSLRQAWLCGRITQRLSPYSVLRKGHRLRHSSQGGISQGLSLYPLLDPSIDRLSIYRFPERDRVPCFATFHPSSASRRSTRCPLSDLRYLRSSVMRTQRKTFEGLAPPNRSERGSSADRLPIRMKFPTSSVSRNSRPHYRWHTIWPPGGV